MKTNNKGFTMVELIVVMLIIGIITVIVGLTISTSTSARAEGTASSVNALISKCRAGCLSKTGNVYLTLAVDNGSLVCRYYENDILVSTDTFEANGIAVSVSTMLNGPPTTRALTATPFRLSFNRSTGAQTPQSDGSNCTALKFTGGRTYTVELVPSTGSHRLL